MAWSIDSCSVSRDHITVSGSELIESQVQARLLITLGKSEGIRKQALFRGELTLGALLTFLLRNTLLCNLLFEIP